MNKKIITAILTVGMLISANTVFASYTEDDPEIQEDAMILNQEDTVVFHSYRGTVINAENDLIDVEIEADGVKATYGFGIGSETKLVDGEGRDIEAVSKNDTIIVITEASLLTKDIKPLAAAFVKTSDNASAKLAEFVKEGDRLISNEPVEYQLVLSMDNIDEYAGKTLLVLYEFATMSIPPMTNPTHVVVVEDTELSETTQETENVAASPESEPDYLYELSVDWTDIQEVEGIRLVPVRKYSELLGFEVTWHGEDMSVTIGTVPMGVSFRIGENSYSKARMTPFVLELAPQLINGTTYVPISFFEQVLEAKTDITEPEYLYTLSTDLTDIQEVEGVKLIPVRKYSEMLGFEVTWHEEDMSVTVGTVPMGVSFKIGENSYSKSRMTPFVLETAPELINGATYVPISFFEQILEAKIIIAK